MISTFSGFSDKHLITVTRKHFNLKLSKMNSEGLAYNFPGMKNKILKSNDFPGSPYKAFGLFKLL